MNIDPGPDNRDAAPIAAERNATLTPSSANAIFRPTRGLVSEQNLATPLGSAWLGIVFAGGCFPMLVALLATGFVAASGGVKLISWLWRPEVLLSVVFAFFPGYICAIAGTIPAYCILQFCRFCTGWILTERGACGIFGGLTGFLCTTIGGLNFALAMSPYNMLFYIFAFVPGAVAIGHFGGIHGCFMKRHKNDWFKAPFFDPNKRISIKFFLGLTTAVAIFVICCKAAGKAGLWIGLAWTMYALLQTLLLAIEHAWRIRIKGVSPSDANAIDQESMTIQ